MIFFGALDRNDLEDLLATIYIHILLALHYRSFLCSLIILASTFRPIPTFNIVFLPERKMVSNFISLILPGVGQSFNICHSCVMPYYGHWLLALPLWM